MRFKIKAPYTMGNFSHILELMHFPLIIRTLLRCITYVYHLALSLLSPWQRSDRINESLARTYFFHSI